MRPEREDHMIARLDRSHTRPVLHHDAGGLVSEHHRQRHWPVAVHDVPIAHAHARGFNLHAHLVYLRRFLLKIENLQGLVNFSQYRSSHVFSLCWNASLLHRLGTTRLPQSIDTDGASSHLARSPFMNAVNSSGVDGDGRASWVSNCFFRSADRSVLIAALRRLASTSARRQAGAIKPYQLSERTVLKPASPVVGTNKASERKADATASALIASERMCDSSTETSSTIISM